MITAISNLVDQVKNVGPRTVGTLDRATTIPVVNGASISDLTTLPKTSELNKNLEKLTGINIENTFSKTQLLKRFENFATSLATQIAAEISDCIEKHLQALIRKVKPLDYILNADRILGRKIGEVRNKIQIDIDKYTSKLLYKKIQIQQISLMRQKMMVNIKKVCPQASNSAIKKHQTSDAYTSQIVQQTSNTTVNELKNVYAQAQKSVSTWATFSTN